MELNVDELAILTIAIVIIIIVIISTVYTTSLENSINKNDNSFLIQGLGSVYFSIQGISQDKIVEIIQLNNKKKRNPEEASNFLYSRNFEDRYQERNLKEIKTYVTSELNGWVYMKWEMYEFQECKLIVEKFMEHTKGIVAFFYVDPYVDGYEWVIAKNGKITRSFNFDMGEIYENYGIPIQEEIDFLEQRKIESEMEMDKWAKNRKNPLISCEEIYLGVVESTGQNITELNSHLNILEKFYIGTVDLSKIRDTTTNIVNAG